MSDSRIKELKIGDKSIFDMREAMRGRYEDKALKAGDIVIWGDKKIYKVLKNAPGKGATFIKLNIQQIKELKADIDKETSRLKEKIKTEKFLEMIMRGAGR